MILTIYYGDTQREPSRYELKKYRENQMFSRLFSTDLAIFSGTNSLQLLTDQDNLIHDKTLTLLRGLFGTIDILSH